MGTIGDDPKLKSVLDQARGRPELPCVKDISRATALALVECCRQGTAPIKGALILATGREQLINSIKRDLSHVSNRGSCLRVINGVFGMGKTLSMRVVQEYAHREGFATSFVTLTARECPMDDLPAVYRNIVKNIRTADCPDRPALEKILEDWASTVKEDVIAESDNIPSAVSELDTHFKAALTEYYEGIHFNRPEKSDLALRWLRGETTLIDARRFKLNLSHESALSMLGNLTKMLRFTRVKGLVILLDEADAIPNLPSTTRRENAYANLKSLACAASSTPYSYFVYATTPAFFDFVPQGFNEALKNVTTLEHLTSDELLELAQDLRDLHFHSYGWERDDLRGKHIRRFVKMSNSLKTPREFVRKFISSLDIFEENRDLHLDHITSKLN